MNAYLSALLLILSVLTSTALQAFQIIEAVDGVSLPAKVSITEPNRITMARGAMLSKAWTLEGQAVLETDDEAGQLFVTVNTSKAFTLFVRDDQLRTYSLLLSPQDIPAETIVLKPPRQLQRDRDRYRNALPYMERLQHLFRSMISKDYPQDYRVTQQSIHVPLWKEVEVMRVEVFSRDGFVGEHYRIKNVSSETLRMDEREFRNLRPVVLGVSLLVHALLPNEETSLYLVRCDGQCPGLTASER